MMEKGSEPTPPHPRAGWSPPNWPSQSPKEILNSRLINAEIISSGIHTSTKTGALCLLCFFQEGHAKTDIVSLGC